MCVCACAWERERARVYERKCVVCGVCVWEREREKVCVRVRERERKRKSVCERERVVKGRVPSALDESSTWEATQLMYSEMQKSGKPLFNPQVLTWTWMQKVERPKKKERNEVDVRSTWTVKLIFSKKLKKNLFRFFDFIIGFHPKSQLASSQMTILPWDRGYGFCDDIIYN